MIIPRNTLVVVRLMEQGEKTVGNIKVPTNDEMYCEAEVMAVGPGSLSAEGGRTETFDLAAGQRVMVKHKERRNPDPRSPLSLAGIRYQDGDEFFYIFEQSSVIGIIAQPGATPTVDSRAKVPATNIVMAN